MAYNSAHTGPEIDAAVQLLGEIQEAKDTTAADRQAVTGMAAAVATQASQVSSQASQVSSNTAVVLASASAVEADRAEVEQNTGVVLSAKTAAQDAEAAAVAAQRAVEVIQQSVSQSQIAAEHSEQSAGESASAAREDRVQVELLAQQTAEDSASAAESAAAAAAVVTGGTATLNPEPGKIPLAKGDGKIDEGWLPAEIARESSLGAISEQAEIAISTADAAQARTARFLESAPTPPELRDNGLPLQPGDRYFSTETGAEYIFRDGVWLANDSSVAIADLAIKLTPNGADFGAQGDGIHDDTSALTAAVNTAWAVDLNAGVYPISSTVKAGGKPLETKGSVRAMPAGGSADLAHDQIVKGMLFPERAYQKFDSLSFWKVGPVVAFWGDSNTAFCDASANRVSENGEGSTPANVEMKLKEYIYYSEGRVRGDGAPGQTAEYGWTNLEGVITNYSPQIMVLAWGTNDISKGYTREQYLGFMSLQIERLLIAGVRPLVQSIPYHGNEVNRAKVVAWNSSLKSLCSVYGVKFIPLYSLFANKPDYYFWSDKIHYQAPATRMIAQILCDAILDDYGLPKERFNVNKVQRGALAIDTSFNLAGLRHSVGKSLTIVQTPNIYLRQFYPYSIRVPAGTELHFQCAGPFCAIFNRPDSPGTGYKVNGSAFTTLSRGNTIAISSVATRFDGSYSNFRVSHDTSDMYLVATHSMAEFPMDMVCSPAEISASQFLPNRAITISDGARSIVTVMQDVALGLKGSALNSAIPNVGAVAVRTAITAAPEGFLFLQTGTISWWRWSGGVWSAA